MLASDPTSFSATLDESDTVKPEYMAKWFADLQNAAFAVEAEGDLVAVASIARARKKFAHRAKVWGVFVEPEYRGRGLGRVVMSAAIEWARAQGGIDFVDLAVSESALPAQRLYENLGFHAWGREPEATDHDGKRFDEIHMTLRL